jgi:glutathione S-transferase
MHTLYHATHCPFSRKIRVILGEKKLSFDLVTVKPWADAADLLPFNPAGEVPLLADEDGLILADSNAIAEYLDEAHPIPVLISGSSRDRAEVRRLVSWFDGKFNRDVTIPLVGEKLEKRLRGGSDGPDSRLIRQGYGRIREHMEYIGWLAENRRWLAGEVFSLADITAAAHLSAVDYLGDVPWENHPTAKEWYARVKSRPSVRPLLADVLPGIPPPRHYADLDF